MTTGVMFFWKAWSDEEGPTAMSTHIVQPQCTAQLAHLKSRQALVSLAGMPSSRCFSAGYREAAE